MRGHARVRDVLGSIGRRSIVATVLVFLLTVAATFVVGVRLYDATKESIVQRGELSAKQSAMSFDRYLLVRKNTVLLASNVVNNMVGQGRPTSEILDYLVAESKSIQTP